MSLRKATQLYETESHYVVRKASSLDGEEHVAEETFPKTEEGFEAAWEAFEKPKQRVAASPHLDDE